MQESQMMKFCPLNNELVGKESGEVLQKCRREGIKLCHLERKRPMLSAQLLMYCKETMFGIRMVLVIVVSLSDFWLSVGALHLPLFAFIRLSFT